MSQGKCVVGAKFHKLANKPLSGVYPAVRTWFWEKLKLCNRPSPGYL